MDFNTWLRKRWWLCLTIFFVVGALAQLLFTGTIIQRLNVVVSFAIVFVIYQLEKPG